MSKQAEPNIAVIALGGTIAMTRASADTGVAPTLSASDLIAAVPGLDELAAMIEPRTLRTTPGASLSLADLAELAALIDELADDGTDGVIVTQGTDTLEETAFFLDITVASDVPVVVTGAMRNPTLAGADGPANLLAAAAVAADDSARGRGCLVAMSDDLHAAQHVRKIHTSSTGAFASPDTGPIGYVAERTARFFTPPNSRVLVPAKGGTKSPSVPVIPTTLGDDLPLLRPRREDLDGLVVAAFGVGHVPASTVELLTDYANHIPVVLASRTGAGPIHYASYAFAGSESDLRQRGLIGSGYLDPYKARILLTRLLDSDASRDTISQTFHRFEYR